MEHRHELVEGEVLVGIGLQRGLAHAPQDREEIGVSGQAGADGQRVDEEPDKPLDLGRVRPAIGVPTAKSSWPE